MRHGKRAFDVMKNKRLRIFDCAGPGRGIAYMTDSDVSGKTFEILLLEVLVDQAHPFTALDPALRA